MKIAKRIGIVLGVLIVIWLILAVFAPSSAHVQRTTIINAPSNVVYDNVNNFHNWKSWSYWDNIDKVTMNDSFSGPEAGVGAVHYWNSPNDSVGKGSIKITKSEPNTFIETELNFDGYISMGGWKMKDTTGGTAVTTYMDMDSPFLMRPMMLFMNMDEMLGSDFEKTLAGLKRVSESTANATPSVKIEATTVESMKIMSIMDSCTSADIGQKLGSLYAEVGEAMKKQGLNQVGAPFAVYHKVTNNPDGSMHFVLQAGIPVDKEGKTEGRVKYWQTPPGNVVKAWHYGTYESTGQTHEIMHAWMAKNGKTADGAPWEVYATDPMVEKDTAKWLTEIYYPVK